MENVNDNSFLCKEKISKLLFKFSVPCVISLLISALYNIVDQIFIGNSELGFLGNAATGVVFPFIVITQAFAWWIGDGCAAHLSICQGRNDVEKSHKSIGSGITLLFIISIVLMIVALLFKEPILKQFGAGEDTLGMASSYLTILCIFFPFFMLQNMLSPVIRSDGSPIYSMLCLAVGAIVNIILDPIFIFVFKWGIEGAAWATVIGQVVSFIISAIYFIKPKTFKMSLKSFIPDFKIFKEPAILGISSFITQIAIVAISLVCNMMLFKYGVLSKYGENIPISIISIQTKVFTVLINLVVGIVLGGQPILGFNIGAGRYDRVKQTYKYILLITLAITVVFTLVNEIYPEAFILLFGDGGEFSDLYLEYGKYTFRIFMSLSIITCFIKMNSLFFQAVEKPVFATVSSLARDLLFFLPLVIILPAIAEKKESGSGIIALLYAAPIADILAGIIAVIFTVYFFKHLGKEKLQDQDNNEEVVCKIQDSKPGLIFTIAREHGSLGKLIGKEFADKMGIPFYSKEIIALAASKSGLCEEYLSNVHSKQALVSSLYLSKEISEEAINAQKEAINKIAEKGSCVIVGRAADYILKDNPNLVSIFIYANYKVRVKNIMEAYNDSEDVSKKNIKSSDDSRAKYYELISNRKWGHKHNYTLCIDSSKGKDEVVNMLYNMFKDKN